MSTLDVIYWNVYFLHKPASVLRELKEVTKTYKPEIIGLGEAKFMYPIADDVPGYRRIQLSPRRFNRRTDERADSAILVRKDVEVLGYRFIRMGMRWRVPRKTIVRDPRIYVLVRVRHEGRTWKVMVAHWPFGKAQEETKGRVKRWFLRHPRMPIVHVGDLNARQPEIAAYAKACRAKQTGVGIDRAIYKNIRAAAYKNLGKRGSDHPMVLFRFTK